MAPLRSQFAQPSRLWPMPGAMNSLLLKGTRHIGFGRNCNLPPFPTKSVTPTTRFTFRSATVVAESFRLTVPFFRPSMHGPGERFDVYLKGDG